MPSNKPKATRRGTPTERTEEEATAKAKLVTETGRPWQDGAKLCGYCGRTVSTSQETSVQPLARNLKKRSEAEPVRPLPGRIGAASATSISDPASYAERSPRASAYTTTDEC